MYAFNALTISGYDRNELPNTFVRQGSTTGTLGVLFPGLAYTTDMPLLYYTRAVLLDLGADTLSLEVNYAKLPAFREAAPEEQSAWLDANAEAACAAALAQRPYERICLVGKSIGTLALGHLLAHDARLAGADCVWLTPLFHEDRLRQQVLQARPRSLFIAGAADALYSEEHQAKVAAALGSQSLIIAGANHSLEIPGDVAASLQALSQVTEAVYAFLR